MKEELAKIADQLRIDQGELVKPTADWLMGYHYGFTRACELIATKIRAYGVKDDYTRSGYGDG